LNITYFGFAVSRSATTSLQRLWRSIEDLREPIMTPKPYVRSGDKQFQTLKELGFPDAPSVLAGLLQMETKPKRNRNKLDTAQVYKPVSRLLNTASVVQMPAKTRSDFPYMVPPWVHLHNSISVKKPKKCLSVAWAVSDIAKSNISKKKTKETKKAVVLLRKNCKARR